MKYSRPILTFLALVLFLAAGLYRSHQQDLQKEIEATAMEEEQCEELAQDDDKLAPDTLAISQTGPEALTTLQAAK